MRNVTLCYSDIEYIVVPDDNASAIDNWARDHHAVLCIRATETPVTG